MTNTANSTQIAFLLENKDKIQKFLKSSLAKQYAHISVNGLILSPFIQDTTDFQMKSLKLKVLRNTIQELTPYLLQSDDLYPYWIRQSVSYWGSTELFTRIFSFSSTSEYLNNFDEIGRLDFMDHEASEINMNWIDSLIDYKDTELILYELWDVVGLPTTNTQKQPSFLDHVIDVMVQKTISNFPNARYIGWIDSKKSMFSTYWPREKRFAQYVEQYLKVKGCPLEVKLITIENLPELNLDDVGAIYNLIAPNELSPALNNDISRKIYAIASEGKLISPIHTYPLEHKALQALFWDDAQISNLNIDKAKVDTIRSIFPQTTLLSELLKTHSKQELIAKYRGYYMKHAYSWCGQKVMKLENECNITMEIIKECIENPVSWILQAPADHVNVSHVQYSLWNEKVQQLNMIADAGIQYHYNPMNTVAVTISCSRNSLHSDKGIVSHNEDNVFRPAVVLLTTN